MAVWFIVKASGDVPMYVLKRYTNKDSYHSSSRGIVDCLNKIVCHTGF